MKLLGDGPIIDQNKNDNNVPEFVLYIIDGFDDVFLLTHVKTNYKA